MMATETTGHVTRNQQQFGKA